MTAKGKLIRNIIIAVVAVAILGGGYYFAIKWEPAAEQTKKEEKPVPETVYVLSERAEDVSRIHIVNPDAEYDITKAADGEDTVYEIPSITSGDASPSAIGAAFGAMIKMSATKRIEKGVENAESFGLTDAQIRYTVSKIDGSEITVLIGDEVPTGGEFYCMREGGAEIYTIGAYKAEIAGRVPDDYRNISILAIDNPQSVTDFTLLMGGETVMDIRLATDEENDRRPVATIWAMNLPWKEDVNDSNLVKLFERLCVIEATGFADTGAAFTPEYRFEITAGGEKHSFSVGGTAPDGGAYLRDEATGIVYTVDKAVLDTLKGVAPNDYIGKIVKLADIEKVSRVVVRRGETEYIMETGDAESKPYVINGAETDESSFKKNYQAVLGVLFKERGKFTVSGEPYLTITYEFKDGTTDSVRYHEADEGEYVAVRSDGSTVKVLRSALTELDALFENK